jgi:hypothetical protein
VNNQIITIIVVTASAVLNFLLTQPAGTFPQNVLLVIGATSVALTAIARFLPSAGTPVQVEVKGSPVEVTPVPAEDKP